MRLRQLLITAALLLGGAGAAAAQSAAIFDPDQVPATQGTVGQYSLTPRGDVDGLILEDGTQVHLPPHLGGQLVQAVRPGDRVTIHGLKAQALPVMQALSVEDARTGRTVVDTGPPAAPPPPLAAPMKWLTVQGRVRAPLYGPDGDRNGALLEDGTQVHVPPDQVLALGAELRPGQALAAEGEGVDGPYGRALDAERIGTTATQLVEVEPPGSPPPPPPGPSCRVPPCR